MLFVVLKNRIDGLEEYKHKCVKVFPTLPFIRGVSVRHPSTTVTLVIDHLQPEAE